MLGCANGETGGHDRGGEVGREEFGDCGSRGNGVDGDVGQEGDGAEGADEADQLERSVSACFCLWRG